MPSLQATRKKNRFTSPCTEAGGLKDSLDQKIYNAVKEQAGEAGFKYEDGPAY